MSDYILTYTKTKFYPLELVMEGIKIEDIVHALSLMTRANGHLSTFILWRSIVLIATKKQKLEDI